ncbi:MAG: hypothetical protein EPN72_10345 [Nevskiaceae bacterium]|nr:MAG: hypothetical protein EPN61_01945 [Burkholderiaceae bacterium]TBR72353.1 MAG: hypothetical protein EPN72_10345 [Nevskiaceae bacterium]
MNMLGIFERGLQRDRARRVEVGEPLSGSLDAIWQDESRRRLVACRKKSVQGVPAEGDVPAAFVLGAKDSEMILIASLLHAAEAHVGVATRRGKRVYPGNAYRADPPAAPLLAGVTVYAVECGWAGEGANVVHIDHHRPGDAGYGRPPREYFSAASIGQVLAVLERDLTDAGRASDWRVLQQRFGAEARLVAAADHCLGAAYRGACPGVDPQELMAWCVRGRAVFEHRAETEVEADVQAACHVIRERAVDGLADLRTLPGGTVPEAPQAACRCGIAVLTRVVDREGREKIGLLGATAAQVERFLAGRLVPGLAGCYGDPARGFAGGYVVPGKT